MKLGSRRRARAIPTAMILAVLTTTGASAEGGFSTTPFRGGEVLRYGVRYGPIRLGTLVVTQEEVKGAGGGEKIVVRMCAESAPGLPFLKTKWANRSLLVPSFPSLRDFEYASGEDDATRLHYLYDAARGMVEIERECATGPRTVCRLRHDGPVYDAGGMFMMIRCMSGSGRRTSLPAIVDQEIRPTRFDFTDAVEDVEVPAFATPVKAHRFDAVAEWVLPTACGMSGEFHGWLTADGAAIPLKGTVHIFLGAVTIELESFERP